MNRWMLATFLALGTVGVSADAFAWHWGSPFAGAPWLGAGGNFYTGSPRSLGVTCASCHIGTANIPPAQRVQMQVTTRRVSGGSLVADDIFAAGYMPGARYKITVTMVGEHKGRQPSNGAYEDPNGSAFKVNCPLTATNRDLMTGEIMTEANVYASFDGNAAGRLRADEVGDPNSTAEATYCRDGFAGCFNGVDIPGRPNQGGPTTVSYRSWRLTNPNANPPFGEYSCTICDAIVANHGVETTPSTGQPFSPVAWHFFWTAPSPAPTAGNGRIRFYLAMLDGDGYTDTYDDDIAEWRRAACPVGNASCNPTNPPWNFTAAPPPPVISAPPLSEPPAPLWILAAVAALLGAAAFFTRSRPRRAALVSFSTVVLLAAVAFASSGCVNVRAWERGRLASAVMTKGADVEEAMIERTFLEAREASTGGSAAGAGGGCACN